MEGVKLRFVCQFLPKGVISLMTAHIFKLNAIKWGTKKEYQLSALLAWLSEILALTLNNMLCVADWGFPTKLVFIDFFLQKSQNVYLKAYI